MALALSWLNNSSSDITSKLSERPLKLADQKPERGKILIPEYSIDRDQPTSRASPLRINVLLYDVVRHSFKFYPMFCQIQ